jgi:hypothetical protein
MKLVIRPSGEQPRGWEVELPLPAGTDTVHYPCTLMVVATEPGEKPVEYSRTLIVGPRGGLSLSPP